ncbi:Trypsin domain protein [Candidatus Rhodobacter oscarellae]|uniref:Trypsin domain protein n=1 Tax=Candidatus Rhodobacter oscarellae TaxID=1675527 RepID=A0A0J9E707_9RHOB|nr:Trypsin domain protein [Candidatus Rhodobacter lobularis]
MGKLTIANRAMCTGALIAPDLVLTAAHCLYDPYSGRSVRPRKIRFEAGLTGGNAKAARSVIKAVEHPSYRHNHGGANDPSVDIAILKLDSPISGAEIQPFATDARPEKGDALGVISYTHLRRDTPLWQHPCDVLAKKGDVLVMNCEVDFGASGAPVFAVQGGSRPRLVSVISSKAALGDRPVSVGTIIDSALALLLQRAG